MRIAARRERRKEKHDENDKFLKKAFAFHNEKNILKFLFTLFMISHAFHVYVIHFLPSVTHTKYYY
jgi:hypothetical protein